MKKICVALIGITLAIYPLFSFAVDLVDTDKIYADDGGAPATQKFQTWEDHKTQLRGLFYTESEVDAMIPTRASLGLGIDDDVTFNSVTVPPSATVSNSYEQYEATNNGSNKVTFQPSASLSEDKTIVSEKILQTTDIGSTVQAKIVVAANCSTYTTNGQICLETP